MMSPVRSSLDRLLVSAVSAAMIVLLIGMLSNTAKMKTAESSCVLWDLVQAGDSSKENIHVGGQDEHLHLRVVSMDVTSLSDISTVWRLPQLGNVIVECLHHVLKIHIEH